MSYRGGRYFCTPCGKFVTAEMTLVMDPRGNDPAPAAAKEKRQGKPKASRYSGTLLLQRLVRKGLIILVLIVLASLAYLPLLSQMAYDRAFKGETFDKASAPGLVVLSARIHMFYRRPDDAVKILEDNLDKLSPEVFPDAYYYLGVGSMKAYDLDSAIKYMTIFLERWPRDDRAIEISSLLKECKDVIAKKELNARDRQ